MAIVLPKLSPDEVEELQSSLELDLMAYYLSLQDEILDAMEEHKDKSVDDIIHEIGKLI